MRTSIVFFLILIGAIILVMVQRARYEQQYEVTPAQREARQAEERRRDEARAEIKVLADEIIQEYAAEDLEPSQNVLENQSSVGHDTSDRVAVSSGPPIRLSSSDLQLPQFPTEQLVAQIDSAPLSEREKMGIALRMARCGQYYAIRHKLAAISGDTVDDDELASVLEDASNSLASRAIDTIPEAGLITLETERMQLLGEFKTLLDENEESGLIDFILVEQEKCEVLAINISRVAE